MISYGKPENPVTCTRGDVLCDQGLSSSVLGDGNCLGGSNKYSGQLTPSIYLTGSTSTVQTIFEPVNGRRQKLIPFSSRTQHVTKLKKICLKYVATAKMSKRLILKSSKIKKLLLILILFYAVLLNLSRRNRCDTSWTVSRAHTHTCIFRPPADQIKSFSLQ